MGMRSRKKLGLSLQILLAMATLALAAALSALVALAAPAGAPQAATLPAETCTLSAGVRTCELWATTGTISLPGSLDPVTVWGYAETAGGAATVPGPTLIANEGETVEVGLHNILAEPTALHFGGQALIPDLVGVGPGGVITYTLENVQPGTYLYEAGLLLNAQHQVAMGMFGALVVRPTVTPTVGFNGQAYAGPDTAYHDEALLVLSEVDPALNNSADPAAFDMRNYKPKYWLINGKVYPQTDEILTMVGNQVLLRFINAGLQPHSMSLLGLEQTLLAVDGNPLPYSRNVVVNTVAPGQTFDTLVSMPITVTGQSKYGLYDSNLMFHNNNQSYGGMLTFISIADGPVPGIGPTTAAVSLMPHHADETMPVDLSATINGAPASTIVAAEYFVDATGVAGAGCAMTGAFGSATVDVGAVITTTGAISPCADLATLTSGDHTFYVHGSDGVWGAFNFAVLHLDKLGPMTKSIVLSPNPSDGSVAVNIQATGDEMMTGHSDVVAAEYVIDNTAGLATAMSVSPMMAHIASLNATIDVTTTSGLAEGEHTLYVRSQDAFGHWGDYATAALQIDQTGPDTSGVTAAPNPNNGALPINPSQQSLRVDATLSEPGAGPVTSTVKTAEGFIDTLGADGTGFPFTPLDGLFNSPVEEGYAFIPLPNISLLAEGTHQIHVHGQDASGNWGTAVTTDLIIDKTTPTVSNVVVAPNPTNAVLAVGVVTLTADAADPLSGGVNSNIVAAEYFIDTDPGVGNGIAMQGTFGSPTAALTAQVDVSGLGLGIYTLYVRAMDGAGNWSPEVSVDLSVVPDDLIFADSFETGDTSRWGSTVQSGGNLTVVNAAAMGLDGGVWGMRVALSGTARGFVIDRSPTAEPSYHARFYFHPNGTLTGSGLLTGRPIFAGVDTGGANVFWVEYRRLGSGGSNLPTRVRGVALSGGTTLTTDWYTITNAPHAIEIAWSSGPATTFELYVDGILRRQLTGLNTSGYAIETVRLGVPLGAAYPSPGVMFFDAFVSRRNTIIGP